jgi:hypothetical protein
MALNLSDFYTWLSSEKTPAYLNRVLDREVDGRPLRDLLIGASSEAHPVMSNQSQALFLLIRKPTVGVPERILTLMACEPEAVAGLAQRFGVSYLIAFRQAPINPFDPPDDCILQVIDQDPPFLTKLYLDEALAVYRIRSR